MASKKIAYVAVLSKELRIFAFRTQNTAVTLRFSVIQSRANQRSTPAGAKVKYLHHVCVRDPSLTLFAKAHQNLFCVFY